MKGLTAIHDDVVTQAKIETNKDNSYGLNVKIARDERCVIVRLENLRQGLCTVCEIVIQPNVSG